MTLLAAKERSTSVTSRRAWRQQVIAGILVAAALLTLVTMLPLYLPELVLFRRAGYLVAVIVAALVGGRWTAWLAAPAAALLADYYITAPLHTISLLRDPADMTFFAVIALVAALAVVAARNLARPAVDVTQAVDNALREHVNAEYWCAMYRRPGQEREQFALWKPGQPCEMTAQLFADAAHGLPCDCDNCRALLAS